MVGEQEPAQKWEAQSGRDRVLGGFSAERGAAGIKRLSLSGGRPAVSWRGVFEQVCLHLGGSLSDLSSQTRSAVSTNGYSQAFSSAIYPCLNVCKISPDDTFSYELAGLADTNQEANTIFSKHIKSPSNMQHAETLFVITLKYQKLEECQLLPSDGNNNDIGRNN